LIVEVLKLRDLTINQFDGQRGDFEDQVDTLGPQIQQGNILADAPEPPVLIRVVHAP